MESNRHLQHLESLQTTARQIQNLMDRQNLISDFSRRQSANKQEVLDSLLNRQQDAALIRQLSSLHPADLAYILESFSSESRERLWSLIPKKDRGAVMLELADEVRTALLGTFTDEDIYETVSHLDTAQLAEFLNKNPHTVSLDLLAQINEQDRKKVQTSLGFPNDSVGALMELDMIIVQDNMNLSDVLNVLNINRNHYDIIDQAYVVDDNNNYAGTILLKKILFNPADTKVIDIMETDRLSFFTNDPADDAVSAFDRYDLLSAPVLNNHNQIVGNLFVNRVMDYMEDKRETEQFIKAGFSEKEDIFTPAWHSAKNRWLWLGLNLITAFIASRVIGAFEATINQLIALATLMPIVASVGGNTGNQTLALMVRSMSLGQINKGNLRLFLSKELLVSLINGLLWGLAVAVFSYIFYGNEQLSLIMLAAMITTLLIAALAGIIIPFTLESMGRDPVMGSSVLLTAVTDSTGFFIFLGMASMFLV